MATVIDLLRHLGQNAAPDGGNALAGPLMLPGITDSPLQLPLPTPLGPRLLAEWSRITARKTLGHHALAFSAAQTGHPVALMGHGASAHHDLLLIALGQLLMQPQQTALWLLHENSILRAPLITLAEAIGLTWLDAGQHSGRITPAALVIATPQDIHRRVLRFHDRAWRWLWSRLRWAVLPEVHHFTGAAAGHLQWLLRRIERLQAAADSPPLQLLMSLAPIADAEAALARLQPVSADDRFETARRPLKLIAAPDGPGDSTLIALWRSGPDRMATLTQLIERLAAHRLAVTVLGRDAAETAQIRAALAERVPMQPAGDARVALISGLPLDNEARHALLRAPYRLLILLAADEPHEQLFVTAPDRLLQSLPYWPQALANPYISADHLICAAAELPLDEAEIDRWHMRELRDRLLKKHKLQPLPGADLWQTTPGIDPYDGLDPRAVGGDPVEVYAPDGTLHGFLAPALVDRCALPGQVWATGLRVAAHDEGAQRVQLEHDPAAIETFVQANVRVVVREEQAARSIRFGKHTSDLTKGRVIATQQITGLCDLQRDGTQRRMALRTLPETQWSAAACWLPLPLPPGKAGYDRATLGWSLQRALPLLAPAASCNLVPAYDAELERLYLIEAEPGGIGLITGLYERFERLIELAQALVEANTASPLYGAVARSESAWLDALTHTVRSAASSAAEEQPPQSERRPAKDAAQTFPVPINRTAQKLPVEPPSAPQSPRPERVELPEAASPEAAPPERRVIPFPARPAATSKRALRPAIGAERGFEPPQRSAASVAAPAVEPRASAPPPTDAPPAIEVDSAEVEQPARRTAIYNLPAPRPQATPEREANINQAPPSNVTALNSAEAALVNDSVQTEATGASQTAALPDVPADALAPLHEIGAIDAADATDETILLQADEPIFERIEEAVVLQAAPEALPATPALVDAPENESATEPDEVIEAAPASEPEASAASDEPAAGTLLPFVHEQRSTPRAQPEASQRISAQHMIEDLLPPIDDNEDDAPMLQFVEDAAPEPVQPAEAPEPVQPVEAPPPQRPASSVQHDRQQGAAQRPTRFAAPRGRPASPRAGETPTPRQTRHDSPRARPSSPPAREPARQIDHRSFRGKPPGPDQSSGTSGTEPPQREQRSEPPRREPTRPDAPPQPPARPAAQKPAPEPERPADVNAMIARMRRLREQRESEQGRSGRDAGSGRADRSTRSTAGSEPVEVRFHIGERVQCLPYGIGIVRRSSIVHGRETVVIEFLEYGEIEVDPAISLVRSVQSRASTAEDEAEA